MREMSAINRLTVLIVLTTAVSIWLLSMGAQGVHAGIAAWVLFAALCVLLTLYSIRTRWYVRGLVRPDRLEDDHEVAAPARATENRPEHARR